MKAGELAASLGISRDTLYAWMRRPELVRFFSQGAMGDAGSAQRWFSDGDVLIFTTINHLRYTEKVTEWDTIIAYLDSGKRYQDFPQNAISADPRTIPILQAEQSAKAMATMAERDAALARVEQLEREIELLRAKNEANTERLLREIAELRYTIGRLESQKKDE